MKSFSYSMDEWKLINRLIVNANGPFTVGGGDLSGLVFLIESQCENFILSVETVDLASTSITARKQVLLSKTLELFPMDDDSELRLDKFRRLCIESGKPPRKSLALMLVDGLVSEFDYTRYLLRTELKLKFNEFSSDPTRSAAKHNYKEPRDSFFVSVFGTWAAINGLRASQTPISDPLETPAQQFIRAVTEPVFRYLGFTFGKDHSESYPDGKTVANAIRRFKSEYEKKG